MSETRDRAAHYMDSPPCDICGSTRSTFVERYLYPEAIPTGLRFAITLTNADGVTITGCDSCLRRAWANDPTLGGSHA